ncbi:MAG: WD40 repeat domain-containing protein, partial [Anaerolineae bacterium]|nr:WD40 repeat domain-containing protein [Anaerolineae bacterium]
VFTLAFSPDGQYLASGSAAGDVIIWKVPGGDIVHQMEGHSDGTWGIAYSPDGRYLVSGGFIGELFVWDAATGDLIRRLEDIGQSEVLRDLFTVGPYLYARYNQDSPHALLKWNLANGALVSRLDIPDADMNTFAVSPDGSWLLVANYDGTLRLYDASSGEPIGEPFVGHTGGVLNALNTVVFSPDGRYALSGGYDTTVILWDVASGQALRRFRGHAGLISDLTFSPDGRTAISAAGDGFVNLWRVDSLPELITWTYANRYVREVSCNERIQYRLSPAGGSDAAFPTRTPYPTLTPTLTFTPSPTVDLTRTTAMPTATITPTFTATPTATLTPSPTPTATPEAAGALSLDALATEVAGLTPPVTPI